MAKREYRVTYTPDGKRERDVITHIKDAGRAKEHQQAYTNNDPKGGTYKVREGGKG